MTKLWDLSKSLNLDSQFPYLGIEHNNTSLYQNDKNVKSFFKVYFEVLQI